MIITSILMPIICGNNKVKKLIFQSKKYKKYCIKKIKKILRRKINFELKINL